MKDFQEVLSRYFEDRGNFEPEDFLYAYGDPRQALLAYRLFWPQLIRVRSHVVLKTMVDDDEMMAGFLSGLDQPGVDLDQFLAGYRWVEVDYLFAKNTLDEEEDSRVLAQLMAETWLGALQRFEPTVLWRTRVVPPEETGSVWGIEFAEAGG